MLSIDYLSAFIIGLLGSGHCIGMCGGITTMLTSAISPQQKGRDKFKLVGAYNVGRIFSYSLIGAIVGFSSSIAIKNIGVPLGFLRLFAAVFLILLGLYLGQWLMWLSKVEKMGKFLWRYLSPLSKRFIPINNAKQALALGAVWGWLPCGLVYSTLTWSLASGSALSGALIMTSFGLGTLPALLSLSLGSFGIKSLVTNTKFKKIMALMIISYGIYSLMFAYQQLF
ncbi:sulfite exporter TauE/SafE family protein [Colwellia sp. BRX8-7]|jgi:sulfite exporter TauE/SafE|uniref:sulfite exporter TauE/SafE family protein n=1 Tax=Colwellia sp. BRX8-7 TaxID=2759833 RepID=UPI0015F6C0B1|nr:sulfite exporter TauE/SafE family protein [Colwellia sp. BRX8-7]MBA6338958.1 sulfite exporter TauE/SafE family protein [Colwellia sp. BRX8-7]